MRPGAAEDTYSLNMLMDCATRLDEFQRVLMFVQMVDLSSGGPGKSSGYAEIAEWPDWLLALAQTKQASAAWQSGDGHVGMDGRTHAANACNTRDFRARCKSIQRQVELAQVGERNRLLHWASCRFGEMVVEGVINPEIAMLLLESSAKLNGLWRDDGAAQCRATIKSGIAAGVRDARDLGSGDNVVEFKQRR